MKKIIQLQFSKKNDNSNHVQTDDRGDEECEQACEEISVLNELVLSCDGCETDAHKTFKRRVAKKRVGYKTQDVANQIFDAKWFITLDEILELLFASKLKCHYCQIACAISYSKPLFDRQWTLDRICNDQGHNRRNVVISCLKCNLHRGMKSSDKYKLGKQLKFIKTNISTYCEEKEDKEGDKGDKENVK